jgi:hypothetical protein
MCQAKKYGSTLVDNQGCRRFSDDLIVWDREETTFGKSGRGVFWILLVAFRFLLG